MIWALKKVYYRTFQFCMGWGMYFIPWFEPEIIDGPDCIKKLPDAIKEKKFTRVLVVSDTVLMGLKMLEPLFEALK